MATTKALGAGLEKVKKIGTTKFGVGGGRLGKVAGTTLAMLVGVSEGLRALGADSLHDSLEDALGEDLDGDGIIGTKGVKKAKGAKTTSVSPGKMSSPGGSGGIGPSIEKLAMAVDKLQSDGTPVQIVLQVPEDFRTAEMKYEGAIDALGSKLAKTFAVG